MITEPQPALHRLPATDLRSVRTVSYVRISTGTCIAAYYASHTCLIWTLQRTIN